MPRRSPLFLRGLWWRRNLSSAVLGVAALAIAAAALGPLYARAAGESTLRDQLTQGGADTGLHFEAQHSPYDATPVEATIDRAVAAAPTPGGIRGYPSRIVGAYLPIGAHAPDISGVRTAMLWRTGICDHIVIVSGVCPTAVGQVMVSERTVQAIAYGWKLGGALILGDRTVRIAGVYTPRDPDDPFWFGHSYFESKPGTDKTPDTVDAVLVTRPQFTGLVTNIPIVVSVDYLLDPAAIRLADVARLRSDVHQLQAHYDQTTTLPLSTRLSAVLDAAAHQRHLVDVGTLLVTLQLSVLAWLVLFEVIADAIESRGSEIALAKLRGLRPWATIRFGLGESLALLVLALPLGLLLAWAAARLFAATVLAPHTPVAWTASTGAAMLAAFAGGAIAAGLAGYRTLTRTVLSQWRRTTNRHRHSRGALVLDLLVAAAAVAGLVVLRANHSAGSANDTAALLAPGLLVIAVALLGTRLLPLLARGLLPATRASKRIGLFLAGRQVVRRPAGLRLAALLAVAVGLATFAVCGESVAARNRSARAQAELGADRVVSMQYSRGTDPVTAVRRADPAGRWAMAVATWLPDGGDSIVGTVLAVDSSRLSTVGYSAAGGPSTATIAQTIGGSTVPVLTFGSDRLRVTITASALTGPAPQVQFTLRSPQQPFINVNAGTLLAGTHNYTAALDCPQKCTFLGLTWNRPYGADAPMAGRVVVTGLARSAGSDWAPVDAGLDTAGSWRAGPQSGQAGDTVTAVATGLQDDYTSSNGGFGGVTYAFAPSPLPVLATPRALSSTRPDPPTVVDNFNTQVTLDIRPMVAVLPAVLNDGVLADLTFLRAQLPDFDNEATWKIWLGPAAPPDALARLRATGLTVQSSHSVHSRVIQLGRQGPALSLFLLLACAIVGSVLAVGGTAISISASARRRTFEIAALRAIGIRQRSLYWAGVLEQLLLLGTAVVLGLPAGLLAARLAMPVIPEFADTTPIVLRYAAPALPVFVFAVAFIAIVVVAAALASHAVMRAARPSRLREAEE